MIQASRELKRRLVLSKWETYQQQERDWQSEFDGQDREIERLEETLLAVRDWMLGVLFEGKRMSDPLKILRKVEDAL